MVNKMDILTSNRESKVTGHRYSTTSSHRAEDFWPAVLETLTATTIQRQSEQQSFFEDVYHDNNEYHHNNQLIDQYIDIDIHQLNNYSTSTAVITATATLSLTSVVKCVPSLQLSAVPVSCGRKKRGIDDSEDPEEHRHFAISPSETLKYKLKPKPKLF